MIVLNDGPYSSSKLGEVWTDCETPYLNRLSRSYAFSVSKLRSFPFHIYFKVIIFKGSTRINRLRLLNGRSVCYFEMRSVVIKLEINSTGGRQLISASQRKLGEH